MTDADELARANIAYRRPAVYDEMTAGDDQADTVGRIVTNLGINIQSVLGLGCGTGRGVAVFQRTYGWASIGVDLQPGLVDYGRSVRPDIDLQVGDLRTLRLGRTFDLLTLDDLLRAAGFTRLNVDGPCTAEYRPPTQQPCACTEARSADR